MILRGILEQSLGNQLCIRGFAPLQELARLSKADETYQRDFIKEREQDLKEYLETEEYIFFSEVVLGCKIRQKVTNGDALIFEQILEGLNNSFASRFKKNFKSNIDNIELKIKNIPFRNAIDVRGINNIQLIELIIPDKLIESRPLSRIDGNHRLSVAESSKNTTVALKNTPFCIILGQVSVSEYIDETGSRQIKIEDLNQKAERVIFNNINAKAIPLTIEENLKAIISTQDEIFSDSDLKDKFGWSFYAIRQLKKQYLTGDLSEIFPHLGGDFHKLLLTFSKKIIELALNKKIIQENDSDIIKIKKALQETNQAIGNLSLGQISVDLVVACVYIALSKMNLSIFTDWLSKNHITQLPNIDSNALIDIYEKIRESKRKQVFISMQFSPDTECHHNAIKDAVNEVNTKYQQDIKIKHIRIDELTEGYSYDINSQILELIEDSGLLIADISHYNGNVYHEIGYLMGLNRGKGLKHENFLLIKSDADKFKDNKVGFNLTSIKQIRFTDTNQLRKDLVENLLAYYLIK